MPTAPAGTRLTLVRHGAQEPPRHPGDADCPLTEVGRRQARAAAERLADLAPFDVLYSSPFARALETAAPTAEAQGLEVRPHPGLREFLTAPEGAADAAAMGRAWDLARRHWSQAPEGGESVVDFHARVATCLEELTTAHAGEHVLAFCHGGVIKMGFLALLELPLERATSLLLQMDHGAIFRFARVERAGMPTWKLLGWNL